MPRDADGVLSVMVDWGRWGIRCWLKVDWRERGIGDKFVVGWGKGMDDCRAHVRLLGTWTTVGGVDDSSGHRRL